MIKCVRCLCFQTNICGISYTCTSWYSVRNEHNFISLDRVIADNSRKFSLLMSGFYRSIRNSVTFSNEWHEISSENMAKSLRLWTVSVQCAQLPNVSFLYYIIFRFRFMNIFFFSCLYFDMETKWICLFIVNFPSLKKSSVHFAQKKENQWTTLAFILWEKPGASSVQRDAGEDGRGGRRDKLHHFHHLTLGLWYSNKSIAAMLSTMSTIKWKQYAHDSKYDDMWNQQIYVRHTGILYYVVVVVFFSFYFEFCEGLCEMNTTNGNSLRCVLWL